MKSADIFLIESLRVGFVEILIKMQMYFCKENALISSFMHKILFVGTPMCVKNTSPIPMYRAAIYQQVMSHIL